MVPSLRSMFSRKSIFVHSNLHNQRRYSLKKRVIWYILLVLAVFVLFFIGLTRYFSKQMTENTYDNIHETINLYVTQVNRSLKMAEDCLWQLSNNNIDVLAMTTNRGQAENAVNQTKVQRLLENTLGYLSDIEGLFIYGQYMDSYVANYKSSSSNGCSNYLKTLVRSANDDEAELNISNWYILQQDDFYYLMRIMKDRFGYYGAWVRVDSLASPFENSETKLLYVDQNGLPAASGKWGQKELTVDKSLNEPQILQLEDNERFLQISSTLPFTDYFLTVLVPMKDVRAKLDPVIHVLTLIALGLLVAVSFWMVSFNHFFSAPIRMLENFSMQIQNKDLSPRLDLSGERREEVYQIGNALNLLLGEVAKLKIDIYENQIIQREFELQYLKSQVAPHFLINCLSTIGSMPAGADGYQLTQQIIQTLSNHLRYTLSSKKVVPLSEELKYVENYLRLTSVRYPGCLNWEINVQPECENAAVFPFMLLMFTENMVKHNMIMGEQLTAKITGAMRTENGEKHILLVHLDSGDGYPEDVLKILNSPIEEQKHDVDGYHLGMYNIVRRFKLMYGEKYHVRFSNQEGWGARTEIDIPYQPY